MYLSSKLSLVLIIFCCFSCKPEDSKLPIEAPMFNSTGCQPVIVDENLFNNAPEDEFSIINVEVTNNCLNISVSYGGGCGGAEFKLISSGQIMESYPPQMHLKLSFKDEDLCKALVHKTLSYNLNDLKREKEITFHLKGWKTPIHHVFE